MVNVAEPNSQTTRGFRTTPPLRVTVLRGGPSAERSVSLSSGQAVANALRSVGHTVFESDIDPDNLAALDAACDVIFPALHGEFGEDGTLQAIMTQRGLRYVGSQAAASAIAMNKVHSKQVAQKLGCSTAAYQVVQSAGEAITLSLPLVVKPIDQGSSVLTAIIHEQAALQPAITAVVEKFGAALVERFIAGREITVGILDRQPLPPICIRPKRAFFDFEAKYEDDATEYCFDTGLSASTLDQLSRESLAIFDAIGCRHLGRVDWIVDAAETAWFLEINTLPGFTSHSLVPMAAGRVGIWFEELTDRLVQMAWRDS